jgi:hypothetical protein
MTTWSAARWAQYFGRKNSNHPDDLECKFLQPLVSNYQTTRCHNRENYNMELIWKQSVYFLLKCMIHTSQLSIKWTTSHSASFSVVVTLRSTHRPLNVLATFWKLFHFVSSTSSGFCYFPSISMSIQETLIVIGLSFNVRREKFIYCYLCVYKLP